jgi:hypothetical protein
VAQAKASGNVVALHLDDARSIDPPAHPRAKVRDLPQVSVGDAYDLVGRLPMAMSTTRAFLNDGEKPNHRSLTSKNCEPEVPGTRGIATTAGFLALNLIPTGSSHTW